jgi:IS4 transposase
VRENFLTRNRKFNPKTFFVSVLHLAAGTNNEGYFSALSNAWEQCGLRLKSTPAKSSLAEYREKVSFEFFREVYCKHLNRIKPFRRRFKGFYIYAIDGDHLDLPASEDVLRKGFRGYKFRSGEETHYPKMYTAQAVDVLNGTIVEFKHSTTVSEIKMAREMVQGLEKSSITIYDRLHFNYHTARVHKEAKSHFIVRVSEKNPNINLQVRAFCRSKRRSKWVHITPKKREVNRYEPIRVRLVKIKNPRSKEEMVFMSSLPEETFSDIEIGQLYQRRWAIETSFRDLTSTFKMSEWHSQKLNGILQEIYALFWFINNVKLQCAIKIKDTANWLNPKYEKPNFKLCAKLAIDNLELLIRRQSKKFNRLLEYWILKTTEKREHLTRNYPRQIKCWGRKYPKVTSVPRRS